MWSDERIQVVPPPAPERPFGRVWPDAAPPCVPAPVRPGGEGAGGLDGPLQPGEPGLPEGRCESGPRGHARCRGRSIAGPPRDWRPCGCPQGAPNREPPPSRVVRGARRGHSPARPPGALRRARSPASACGLGSAFPVRGPRGPPRYDILSTIPAAATAGPPHGDRLVRRATSWRPPAGRRCGGSHPAADSPGCPEPGRTISELRRDRHSRAPERRHGDLSKAAQFSRSPVPHQNSPSSTTRCRSPVAHW